MAHLPPIIARQLTLKTAFSTNWPPHTHAEGGQVEPVLGRHKRDSFQDQSRAAQHSEHAKSPNPLFENHEINLLFLSLSAQRFGSAAGGLARLASGQSCENRAASLRAAQAAR